MERVIDLTLNADANDYVQGMQAAAEAAGEFNESVQVQTGLAGGVSKALAAMTPGKGMIAGFSSATVAAAAYNKQMVSLKQTTEVLSKSSQKLDFGRMSKDVKAMGRDYGTSATEAKKLLETFHGIGVRGPKAEQNMNQLARTTVKLGKATGESAEYMAQSFGQLSKQFGNLQPKRFEQMGDTLTYVSKSLGTSAASVTQFSRSIAPFAKQIGMSQESVMGLSAAFTTLGEDSFVAQNTVSKMLSDIGRAVRDNTPELKLYAEMTGLTVERFKELEATHPEEIVQKLVKNLAAGDQGIRGLERIGIEGVRSQRALAQVVESGSLEEAMAAVGAPERKGAMDAAAAVAMKDMFSEMSRAAEASKQAGASMGQAFVPVATMGAGMVADVTSGISSVLQTAPVQKAIQVAALGAGTIGIAKMATMMVAPLAAANSGFVRGIFGGRAAEREQRGMGAGRWGLAQAAKYDEAVAKQAAGTGPGPSRSGAMGYGIGQRIVSGREQAMDAMRVRAGLPTLAEERQAAAAAGAGGGGAPGPAAKRGGIFRTAARIGAMSAAAYLNQTVTEPARNLATPTGNQFENRPNYSDRTGSAEQRTWGTRMRQAMGQRYDPSTQYWQSASEQRRMQRAATEAAGGTWQRRSLREVASDTAGRAAASANVVKEYHNVAKASSTTAPTLRTLGVAAKNAGASLMAAGGAAAGRGLGAAGGGLLSAGKGLMGMVGGPTGLAMLGGMGGYMLYTQSKQRREEREEQYGNAAAALSDYTSVLGEATPEMTSFNSAASAASDKLLEMSKQASSYSKALEIGTSRDFQTYAAGREKIHEFAGSDAKSIAAEVTAMSPQMSASALALTLGDITAQFGADVANEVADIVKNLPKFGGTEEVTPESFNELAKGAKGKSGGTGFLGMGAWAADTAQESGAAVGSYFANKAVMDAEKQGSAYEAQTTALQDAGKALQSMEKEFDIGNKNTKASERAEFAQLTEATIMPLLGENADLIGDAVNNAIVEENEDVIKAIQSGASVEEIVKITMQTQNTLTDEQQAQGQAWLATRSEGRTAEQENPWWQTYKEAASAAGFAGPRNVIGMIRGEGNEIQQANVEAGGTDVTKRLAAVDDMFKQMAADGGSLDQMMGQMTLMTQIMPADSIDVKTMQTALQFGSNIQQYSLIGGTRGQKWGAAAEPIMQMMNYKPTNDKELEMVLGAQQQGIQMYQEMVSSYAQQAQATHEYQKQRSRMQEQYGMQRRYAQEDYAKQTRYAREDYGISRGRAERDYNTARTRAERDYGISRSRAYRDYAKQEFRARRDFAIQMERAERDYHISRGRAERDYQINRERAARDFDISQSRAQRDYDISRERAERDYQKQRYRAERDYERSRFRAQRDFEKQQKRTIEEFAKSALDPFKRYGPRSSMTSGGLVTNLGAQNQQLRKQMEGVNKLRAMGMSESAIRTLNLASPEMYSQVQQLLRGAEANPGRINEINTQVMERMDLAGQMAPMQTSWQQQVEDFNQQMQDMGDDFATSMSDMEDDFRTSMDDMAKDFAKSMADAVADFNKSMEDAAQDFARQMRDMEEDFNRSMSDAHADFDKQMADMYSDFSQQMADMAEDFKRQMADMAADHARQMGDMEADFNRQMARAAEAQATALKRMAEAHSMAMRQAEADFNDMVAALDGKWERLGEKMVLESEQTGRDLKAALAGSFDQVLAYFNGEFDLKPKFKFDPTVTWNSAAMGLPSTGDDWPEMHPTGQTPGHLSGMPFNTKDSDRYGEDEDDGNAKNTQWVIDFVKKQWGINASGFARSGHSQNSYHYKGKAVDIGGPIASNPYLGSVIAEFFSQPAVANAFGVKGIIWHRQKNTTGNRGWQSYKGNGVGDSEHVRHVHLSLWDKGGIARRPTLGMIAEAGHPEMMIPLNARGADFFIKLMGRYMDASLDRGRPAAAAGQPLIVNNGTHNDYSTRFTGDVTVQANDPDRMFAELKARARQEALTKGRR